MGAAIETPPLQPWHWPPTSRRLPVTTLSAALPLGMKLTVPAAVTLAVGAEPVLTEPPALSASTLILPAAEMKAAPVVLTNNTGAGIAEVAPITIGFAWVPMLPLFPVPKTILEADIKARGLP